MDPGTLNKMFTRSGYLYLMEKKALTTSWNKYYCHYQKEGRLFFMIFYNQANGKMMSTHTTESFRIKTCTRRITDSIEKRFCFDLTPIDRFVFTFLTRRLFITFFSTLTKTNLQPDENCIHGLHEKFLKLKKAALGCMQSRLLNCSKWLKNAQMVSFFMTY